MTSRDGHSRAGQNAVPLHVRAEDFRDYAHRELHMASPWRFGVCFNPACSRPFNPTRRWQVYCCAACQQVGTAEMRLWGHRLALPLLTWRIGKYETRNEALRDTARAARRFVSITQTLWLQDRQRRQKETGE